MLTPPGILSGINMITTLGLSGFLYSRTNSIIENMEKDRSNIMNIIIRENQQLKAVIKKCVEDIENLKKKVKNFKQKAPQQKKVRFKKPITANNVSSSEEEEEVVSNNKNHTEDYVISSESESENDSLSESEIENLALQKTLARAQ